MRLFALLSLGLLLLAAAGAQATGISTEFIRLTTPDGVETAGLVYTPAGRPPRAGVALVHGYASNFYSGTTGHISRGLAERGFTTLAINMRDHDAGPKTTLFEENRWDEQTAVDELARRGAAPVVLVGSSLGTNRVLFYLAETKDPRLNVSKRSALHLTFSSGEKKGNPCPPTLLISLASRSVRPRVRVWA